MHRAFHIPGDLQSKLTLVGGPFDRLALSLSLSLSIFLTLTHSHTQAGLGDILWRPAASGRLAGWHKRPEPGCNQVAAKVARL